MDDKMRSGAALAIVLTVAVFGGYGCKKAAPGPGIHYDVPLDPKSPWPKFRRDSVQDAQSPLAPGYDGSQPWSFQTGGGIFSSPVIAGDGTIYVGTADRYFYAVNPNGQLRWNFLTQEIIDSSALVDDQGSVYVGSGDGNLYAFDQATGAQKWSFLADNPSTITDGASYIRWFEGNVAIDSHGNLIVPNDNNYLYSVDRNTGAKVWSYLQTDECWSLPAVNVATGGLFFGNNSVYGAILGSGTNVYGLNDSGQEQWTNFTLGSNAASPVITADGLMVLGAFDGYVRAYNAHEGTVAWSFPTRGHIYSSPAVLQDGTIIQPSTDGTIYALNPQTGALVWSFDTLEPIRSSPAIDGNGNIYMGTGGGQLLVLNKNGQRAWAITLSTTARNDMNSSPALGTNAVYLGGEDGNLYSVPYDYCLHSTNSACQGPGGSTLPSDGAFLWYTDALGTTSPTPPAQISANDALGFSLYVRKGGATQVALIDSSSLTVTVNPPADVTTTVSGDRTFLTVVPNSPFTPDANGNVTISVSGQYLENFMRTGLVFSGGTDAGTFSGQYVFKLTADGTSPFPLPIPQNPGDPSGVWEMYDLAAPLPTILPSYNEIGFESLHYLVGMVEGNSSNAIAWVVGGKLAADQNTTEFDPTTQSVFPLQVSYDAGRVTLLNSSSFSLEAMNAIISFDSFRLDAAVNATGVSQGAPHLVVNTNCNNIPTFGAFLESVGFCNPQTHELVAYGSVLLRPFAGSPQSMPSGAGTVAFAVSGTTLTATLTGSTLVQTAHVLSLGIIDETTGVPAGLNYGLATTSTANASGIVQTVSLALDVTKIPATGRVYLLVDAYPVAHVDMALPQ